jgi:hypothetical protein
MFVLFVSREADVRGRWKRRRRRVMEEKGTPEM